MLGLPAIPEGSLGCWISFEGIDRVVFGVRCAFVLVVNVHGVGGWCIRDQLYR